MPGYRFATSKKKRYQSSCAWRIAFDLSAMWTRFLPCAFACSKPGDDEALDALARVDVLVDGDLVGRAALELAAHADVDPLGVLAEDDEVDVLRRAPLQRDEAIGERPHGADVGVEVEAEAHAEEDVARVLERRARADRRARPSSTALRLVRRSARRSSFG